MNNVSKVTRQNIADELAMGNLRYNGRLLEPDFLARLYDLQSMRSRDRRYTNAYDDIHQHMVNNTDWDDNWIYTDPRINLLHSEDEAYLNFLAETIHPLVRSNDEEVEQLLEIYNRHLANDGYALSPTKHISGKVVYKGHKLGAVAVRLREQKVAITEYLNTEYVNQKIELMEAHLKKDPGLSIGTAKELIETVCKSILRKNGSKVDTSWNIAKLLKETTESLDIKPKNADDPHNAEQSIRQIISGIGTVIQGISELRNAYGSGHGKDANFKGLQSYHARLIVGLVSEVSLFYLAISGEETLLIK